MGGQKAVFLGIARDSDIADYLDGVEHDRIAGFEGRSQFQTGRRSRSAFATR